MPTIDARFALAAEVLDQAAAETRKYFRQNVSISTKSDASPVTIADQNTEKLIRSLVTQAFPDDGFLGEETGQSGNQDKLWVIDPIDGTRAFIQGNPLYGVLIGFLEMGIPSFGACALPAVGDVWLGRRGGGASLNGKPIAASGQRNLAEASLVTTSPRLFSGQQLSAFEKLETQVRCVQFGGDCFVHLSVASGWADLAVEVGLKTYDILPIVPIIEAAGGIVTDFQGRALSLDHCSEVITAATPELHAAAMQLFGGSRQS